MKRSAICLPACLPLSAILMFGIVGCEKKMSPEAMQAQESAKKAEERVAALEKQLQEIGAAKTTAPAEPVAPVPADAPKAQAPKPTAEDMEYLKKAHAKSLQKQIADAKKAAEAKKKAAQEAAAQPAPAGGKPASVSVEVPAGTVLEVKLAKDLTTKTVQAGDSWNGTLAESITIDGKTVWPAGAAVSGVVTQSADAGRLSTGNGGLGIKMTFVGDNGVDSDTYMVTGDKRGARNAKIIGGTAALGALVGVLSNKKHKDDHALGGAAIGAAVGTAAAAATADTVIKIDASKPVRFKLAASERVSLR